MYEDRKYKFDFIGFTIKVILLIIFLLVMFKLFPINGIRSVVDKVYAENIEDMKEAAKSYYTVDRLPANIGDTEKMTLQDMINNKMIIEFVDKNNNYCDTFGSYIEVTKTKKDEYVLKVQLACADQIDYILDTIGCYDVCVDCKEDTKVTEFEYKQAVKNVTQVKGCKSGYTLNGNTCYKTIKSDYINATANYYEHGTNVTDAKKVIGGTSKQYTDERTTSSSNVEGKLIIEAKKEYINKITIAGTETYYCGSSVSSSATCSKSVAHESCSPQTCSQVYTGTSCSKPCASCASVCTPSYSTSCSGGGCSTYYTTENYAATVKTTPATYSCPSGYTEELSGTDRSLLKCYKNVATYSCESGYTASGSGANTKCYKTETTNNCPSGYTAEGSGNSLKCYKVIANQDSYYCENSKATLKDNKCYLEVGGEFEKYTCPSGYILDGSKCYRKSTVNESYIMVNKTITNWNYMWSTEESVSGWTRTGNSRLVNPDNTKENNEYKELIENIRTNSDSEINDRLSNVTAIENNQSTNIGMIILYILLGLGLFYLLFMFISVRRTNN